MTRRRHRNSNENPIAWVSVWEEIQKALDKMNAPLPVRTAALSDFTEWRVRNDEMHLYIPDEVREYIERNMDVFKPILWPYILSHHCTRLIYDL